MEKGVFEFEKPVRRVGGKQSVVVIGAAGSENSPPNSAAQKEGRRKSRDSWQIVLGVVSFPTYFYTTFENVLNSFCVVWIEMSLLKKTSNNDLRAYLFLHLSLVLDFQGNPLFRGVDMGN